MKFKHMDASLPLLVVGMCNNPAHASGSVSGYVEDHYKSIITRQPYQVEVCNEVHTPNGPTVFGQGFSLDGAIIGGIIGNNVTKNVENGGTAGAIIGGLLGGQNQGYTSGTQCHTQTRYNETPKRVYSHSTITFTIDGRQQSVRFYRNVSN